MNKDKRQRRRWRCRVEVAGCAGEGKEDGRVKLQKGRRKKNMQSRDRNGGNAPAPLDQTKLPSYSVSVWVWTSGPVWMDLCALALLVTPGWCFASGAPFTLPYVGVCYCNCNQPWEGTGLYSGARPTSLWPSKTTSQGTTQASRANNPVLFVFGWNDSEVIEGQQSCNHLVTRLSPLVCGCFGWNEMACSACVFVTAPPIHFADLLHLHLSAGLGQHGPSQTNLNFTLCFNTIHCLAVHCSPVGVYLIHYTFLSHMEQLRFAPDRSTDTYLPTFHL